MEYAFNEIDDLLGTSQTYAHEEDGHDDNDFNPSVADNGHHTLRASVGDNFKTSMTERGAQLAMRGAPPGWYAQILGMGRTTVQKKLAHVPPDRVVGNGTKLYLPSEVLPILVQPHNLKEHLIKMNPRDLPERLRKEFWGARKLEQQVRKDARELWHSSDVHKAFGSVLRIVKDSVLLWTDELDESCGLSAEQVAILDRLSRELLSNIGSMIEQFALEGVTRSHEAEYDEGDDAVS